MPARAAKNVPGAVKPSVCGQRVAGSSAPDEDHGQGREGERQAGAAAEERDAAGPDREDDQRLGGQRLDEPAGRNSAEPAWKTHSMTAKVRSRTPS
jgi:hypothetical protein